MKKILFAVFFSSILIFNVNALTDDLSITQSSFYVCSDNDIYPTYLIRLNNKNYYYLNMNKNYNFDFRYYNEIGFEQSPYINNVVDYTAYRDWFRELPNYDIYYDSFVQLMIFRYLTGNNDLYLCNSTKEAIYYDERYEENYQKISLMQNGPLIHHSLIMLPNIDYDLYDVNMRHYTIDNLDGINYSRVDSDTIRINDEIGYYRLLFHSGYDGDLGALYSDNTNYLLEEGAPVKGSFLIDIQIRDPHLSIYNYGDGNIDYSSLCFNLVGNDNTYYFCSDSTGYASVSAPVGVYKLEILSDINNNYGKKNLALKEVEKEVYISWGPNEKPDEDNNIEFVPNDTLELSGIIVALFTMIGLGVAIKKTR